MGSGIRSAIHPFLRPCGGPVPSGRFDSYVQVSWLAFSTIKLPCFVCLWFADQGAKTCRATTETSAKRVTCRHLNRRKHFLELPLVLFELRRWLGFQACQTQRQQTLPTGVKVALMLTQRGFQSSEVP